MLWERQWEDEMSLRLIIWVPLNYVYRLMINIETVKYFEIQVHYVVNSSYYQTNKDNDEVMVIKIGNK